MNLSQALRLVRGDIVSFTGGGGKTTAMFCLAQELVSAGWQVVTTSTTRIFSTQTRLAPCHLRLDQLTYLPFELAAALAVHRHVVVTGPTDDIQDKAPGVPAATVEAMSRMPGVDAVLVEADGARMRPLKAPAEHEPVVPACTTILAPVVGLDVLGQPLTEAHVHRPARVAALTGLGPGEPVTPEIIARLLGQADGGLKGRPPGARVAPLLNKLDLLGAEQIGQVSTRLAQRLLQQEAGISEVILGAVATPVPAVEVVGRVAGVILAAGAARRFGGLKQLLPWQGATLLNHVIQQALDAASLSSIVVVLGCGEDIIRPTLTPFGARIQIVSNPLWAEGQSASVHAAIRALREHKAPVAAAVFLLADQPDVTPDVVDALVARHRATLAPLVVPTYRGPRGNPVLFDQRTFPDLLAITGDVGGRPLLSTYADALAPVAFDRPLPRDIDTINDLLAYANS
ncbi:selenium cofactor biosynthesis protein YqeC [Candidatus Amarolinea aalborgensis]|uniref:selenium cofactor biosynthesis protein YqeC n=1 Tax=Candidatus Amarolinea aalborgensis TaxID=2249329 RepID=UPI003BFA262D